MHIEAAQIQVMQHITMHKQLLDRNNEDPVQAVLALLPNTAQPANRA